MKRIEFWNLSKEESIIEKCDKVLEKYTITQDSGETKKLSEIDPEGFYITVAGGFMHQLPVFHCAYYGALREVETNSILNTGVFNNKNTYKLQQIEFFRKVKVATIQKLFQFHQANLWDNVWDLVPLEKSNFNVA